jgi:hypothetical protein
LTSGDIVLVSLRDWACIEAPMRWVRPKIRFGAWCALFALAIQFLIVPSHFHQFPPRSIVGSVVALAGADGGDGHDATPAKPAPPVTEYCALCAVIDLAGTALPSLAPSALQPIAGSPLQSTKLTSLAPSSPPGIFRARAPPPA